MPRLGKLPTSIVPTEGGRSESWQGWDAYFEKALK